MMGDVFTWCFITIIINPSAKCVLSNVGLLGKKKCLL